MPFEPVPACVPFVLLAACHTQPSTHVATALPTSAEITVPTAACSTPERRQFDFWLGDWDVVMRSHPNDDPKREMVTSHGTNRIRKKFDGCVIEETFASLDGPDGPWTGTSVSQWVPSERQWRQTWVDNQGSYLLHYGGLEKGQMILYNPPNSKDGVMIQKRMVFSDVEKDAMNWRWEATQDGGQTWTPEITLRYTRRRSASP